jgi:hypothetical protein
LRAWSGITGWRFESSSAHLEKPRSAGLFAFPGCRSRRSGPLLLGARATPQGTLDAEAADSLWRYQKELVAAARKRDGAAALAVSDASLDNATQRIRALLAAQKDEGSTQ